MDKTDIWLEDLRRRTGTTGDVLFPLFYSGLYMS